MYQPWKILLVTIVIASGGDVCQDACAQAPPRAHATKQLPVSALQGGLKGVVATAGYVGDADDTATVLANADEWYSMYFGQSEDAEVEAIAAGFTPLGTPPYWLYGRRTSALVQMYDLVAPLDPVRAGVYLERLRRISAVLLANRDDHRHISPPVSVSLAPNGQPIDPFRGRAMPAWGAFTEDRAGKWNTDVVTAGLFTYPMAAFARRVADNPTLHARYGADAVHFVTAVMETYDAFRPEMHLVEKDPQAYFIVPQAYAHLDCQDNHGCQNYRDTAGQPLAWNENLSMMKALAEMAIAMNSRLYRASADANPQMLALGTDEVPRLIAKNIAFFEAHLNSKKLADGTPYYLWNHQLPLPRMQDTAHAGFELASFAVLFEDKFPLENLLRQAGRSERIAISSQQYVRFANTFLRKIWHYDYQNSKGLRNVLDKKVDGSSNPSETVNANEECAGWIPLSQASRWIWIRCRDATYHAAGYLREDNHAALLRYRQFLNGSPAP